MTPEILADEALLDFLKETLNIGVGNAAAALEQLLGCPIIVSAPSVHALSMALAPFAVDEPDKDVVGVKMRIVGDLPGTIYFILPSKAMRTIDAMMHKALPGMALRHYAPDLALYAEVANILAGAYLAAINQFCKLNMFHSVPAVTRDMFQAVMDETLALLSRDAHRAILIINEFAIEGAPLRTFLLLFFSPEAEKRLASAMVAAAGQLAGLQVPPK